MAGSNKSSSASKATSVNPHESLSSLTRFFVDGLKDQANLKKVPGEVLKQVIETGGQKTPQKGPMEAGKPVDLRNVEKSADKPKMEILGGIDYRREVVQGVQMRRNREQQEMDQKLQELMNELKRLVKSSTVISNEYASLSIDSGPVASGKYHVNFFDFMLSVIRTARMKVEDSGAWMHISKKKNGYQQKAQSLGTKFTLSQERSTATQTG